VLQQKLIDAGLRTDLLNPDTTPATLVRFDKLFPETIDAGKSFSGRLGNIDTRVATINQAAELENGGFLPKFEYGVDVGGDQTRYVDLVGINKETALPESFYQFVKEDANGIIIRSDELVAAPQIEKALNLPPNTVKLVNTAR
jgi:hypothetical protein